MITDFNSVKFMTAKEKQTVYRQWKLFIKNNFKEEYFKRALYNHLILHCSFIAHYSKDGFYDYYFNKPEDTIRFFDQFNIEKGCESAEYGGTGWVNYNDYSDINIAMCRYFSDLPDKKEIYSKINLEIKERDLHFAKRLFEKHGKEVNF